jgi:hypothetical protein
MDDALIALFAGLVVVGVTLAHTRNGTCYKKRTPVVPAPPPPIAKNESKMGVYGTILAALQTVIEPMLASDPACPPRPAVDDVPARAEVDEIVQQVCRNASRDGLEFHPGVVIESLVSRDDIGRETFVITTFITERIHVTSVRVTVKAERRAANDMIHIRAIAYDPFEPDMRHMAPHIGPGPISWSPSEVDTKVYTI